MCGGLLQESGLCLNDLNFLYFYCFFSYAVNNFGVDYLFAWMCKLWCGLFVCVDV